MLIESTTEGHHRFALGGDRKYVKEIFDWSAAPSSSEVLGLLFPLTFLHLQPGVKGKGLHSSAKAQPLLLEA